MRTKTLKRAIVADDHPVVIKGIQSFLERDGAIRVVATARDTQELAEAVDTTPCDFIFSDIGMRGIDGESSSIGFLRRLAWQENRPKVIVLTMISQPRAGAQGRQVRHRQPDVLRPVRCRGLELV